MVLMILAKQISMFRHQKGHLLVLVGLMITQHVHGQTCSAGAYRSNSTCITCPANTYSTIGSATCNPCPANSWSAAGAGGCTANAGFYDLGNSLMAYYPFNADNVLADSTGKLGSLTGTAGSTMPTSTVSVVPYTGGQAVSFVSASSQVLNIPSITIPDPFTVCLYIYNTGSGSGPTIYHFGNSASSATVTDYILFYNNNGDAFYRFREFSGNNHRGDIYTDNSYSTTNTWIHYCMSWNGLTGSIWKNGSPYSTNVSPNGGTSGLRSILQYTANYLGKNPWGAYWSGSMDEFMIFNRVLTNSEVQTIYNLKSQTGSPLILVNCSSSCSGGTYGHCTPTGSPVCCGAGQYFIEGTSTACQNCPAGTYGSGDKTTCTPCPANTTSVAGSSSLAGCTQCGANTWAGVGAPKCWNFTYPVFALMTEWTGNAIRKMDLATAAVSTVATSLSNPAGVAISPYGDYALYTSAGTHKVFKLDLTSQTSTLLAGSGTTTSLVDGIGAAAAFNTPLEIKISPDGTYALVTDQLNNAIRKIIIATGAVTTLTGSGSTAGYAEGTGSAILLNQPSGIDISSDGTFAIFTEFTGNRVRKLTLTSGASSSSLIAGLTTAVSPTGGALDNTGSSASFSNPQGVIISSDMTFALVADRGNNKIRKIDLRTNAVITLVSAAGSSPLDIALGGLNDMALVSVLGDKKIYQMLYPSSSYSVIAGSGSATDSDLIGTAAGINAPHGIAIWSCAIPGMGVDTTSAVCQRCSAGKYSNGLGLCVACPAGYSSAVGSISVAACVQCPANTYSVAGVGCVGCPVNSTSAAGAAKCTVNMGSYDLGSSLMVYYPFNPNNFLADVSGVTGPATLYGSVTPVTGASLTGALSGWSWGSQNVASFTLPGGVATDGTAWQAYLAIPRFTVSPTVTVCTWYYPTRSGSGEAPFQFGNGPSSSITGEITIWHDASSTASYWVEDQSLGGISGGWALNAWKHGCLALSGTSFVAYLNQANVGTKTMSPAYPGATFPYGSAYLGKSVYANDAFQGYIDEFRIFSRTLSATEVSLLYNFRGDTYTSVFPVACNPSCSAGTYGHCTPTGTPLCCGSGTYFVDGISTACQPCPSGTYGWGNTTACAACPVNKYSSTGSSTCNPCPANSWSAAGAGGCTATAGNVGPVLYLFDGNSAGLSNMGSDPAMAVSVVGAAPTFTTVAGKPSTYFASTTTGGYLKVPNTYSSYTVMFWINLVNWATTPPWGEIFCTKASLDAAATDGINFEVLNTGKLGAYACYDATCTGGNSGATPLTTGQWYHVAVTVPVGSPYIVNIYLNGVAGGVSTPTPTSGSMAYQGLFIGMNPGDGGDRVIKASMQDFRVYNTILSAAKIQSIYNSGNVLSPFITCPTTISCPGGTVRCTPAGVAVCCTAGQYFIEGVSTSCQPCPSGTYGYGNTTSCLACPANTYSSASASTCTACPANTGAGVGASACVPNTGYYLSGGTLYTCTLTGCTSGVTYAQCTTSGSTVCCWAGTYWVPSATSAGCTACAAGTYGLGDKTACTSCPAGTYAASAGASVCTACDAGTTSTDGSSSCPLTSTGGTAAPLGQYWNGNAYVTCPAGSYCAGGSAAPQTCTVCGAGKYTASWCNATMDTQCPSCTAGVNFANTSNATACKACSSCSAGNYVSAACTASSDIQCSGMFFLTCFDHFMWWFHLTRLVSTRLI